MAPALAVLERINCAIGWRTLSDVMATTRPQLWSCIAGTTALAHRHHRQQVEFERPRVLIEIRYLQSCRTAGHLRS